MPFHFRTQVTDEAVGPQLTNSSCWQTREAHEHFEDHTLCSKHLFTTERLLYSMGGQSPIRMRFFVGVAFCEWLARGTLLPHLLEPTTSLVCILRCFGILRRFIYHRRVHKSRLLDQIPGSYSDSRENELGPDCV